SRSFDVRSDEWAGIQNRAINVGLCGEIHNRIEPMSFKKFGNLYAIGNVATYELVPRVARNFVKVAQITGISEEIEINDVNIFAAAEDVTNETGADEPCSAGNENFHLRI